MHNRYALGAWAGFVLAWWATGAQAQAVPTPGGVGDTLKPPPPPPRTIEQPQIRNERPAAAPAVAPGGKTVTVEAFAFTGNTLFTGEQLSAQLSRFTGRPLTLLQIYEAADTIADFYVRAGYTLASVNVPAQKVGDGVVQLEVIEGRIGDIRLEGARRYRASHLRDYLGAARPGTVYRGSALQAGMVLVNELPGLQARALLRPGAAFGTTDIVLQAQEDLLTGGLTVDNHGRENIGELRATGSVTLNNPLGVEDRLTVLGLVSEDALLRYGYLAYSVPVTFSGTRLEMSYGEAQFEVDDPSFDGVEGWNKSGRIGLSRPLVRTRRDRLSGSVALSSTNSNADLSGLVFSATQITLLELAASYSHTHQNLAATQLIAALATNFEKAEFDPLATEGDDRQRLRLELDLQHLQPLRNRSLQLIYRLNGVYSPDALADTQQFSIGGPSSVRGYAASEARGDSGYLASLTLRQPFALGPVSLAGRLFADTGVVRLVDRGHGVDDRSTLSSVGAGLDAAYAQLSATLDLSFPTDDRPVEDHEDPRLFGSVTLAF